MLYLPFVTQDTDTAARAAAEQLGVSPAAARACPLVVIGTASEIADQLQQRRERYGISYYLVKQPLDGGVCTSRRPARGHVD